MSGNRGVCLTEARSNHFVLLRELRLALRAVRLYRVFVVRACHGARVGERIFGGGAVLVVCEQRPFAVADYAAEHAVPDVILPVRAHHFPFDGHGTFFRARRGNHLADIRAVGHGGGSDIGIEHPSVDRDAHAVLLRFAYRAAGNIQHGFGLILVHGRCFAPRLPCLVAARIAVVDMPSQVIQLDAVAPFQTHRCGVFHVLPEFDLHLHLRLYLACLHPKVVVVAGALVTWQLRQLVLVRALQYIRQEDDAIRIFLVVVDVAVGHFQGGGIAVQRIDKGVVIGLARLVADHIPFAVCAATDVLGRGAVVGGLDLASFPTDGHLLGPFVVVGAGRYRACVGLDISARDIRLVEVVVMRKGPAQVHIHTASVFQIDGHGVGVLGMPCVGGAEPGFPLHVHLAPALFGDAHIAVGGVEVLVSALLSAIVVILPHLVPLLETVVRAFVRNIRRHAPHGAVRAP